MTRNRTVERRIQEHNATLLRLEATTGQNLQACSQDDSIALEDPYPHISLNALMGVQSYSTMTL